jgi:prepilin-type N-terminal cleavage/methylation domain-containing protein
MRKTALQQGFTLLELLVVVAIITVMTGALIPGFSGYVTNQNLKQAQEHVKNDMRTVQNRAMAGASADETINGNQVNYWGIRFVQGATTYDYFISDTASCATYPPSTNAVKGRSEKLPGKSVVRSGTRCVFFSLRNGDIVNGADIIVGPPSPGTPCRRIINNSSGLIYQGTSEACT